MSVQGGLETFSFSAYQAPNRRSWLWTCDSVELDVYWLNWFKLERSNGMGFLGEKNGSFAGSKLPVITANRFEVWNTLSVVTGSFKW